MTDIFSRFPSLFDLVEGSGLIGMESLADGVNLLSDEDVKGSPLARASVCSDEDDKPIR